MSMPEKGLSLSQVAFVTTQTDVHTTSDWYQGVFGFAPATWTDKFEGPELANLQKLSHPHPKLTISWLVGRDDAFQLELFEYQQPTSRPVPAGWTPRNIGYTLTTLYVEDFEGALVRARAEGSPVNGPVGNAGERRAVITDPNGILLVLLERDIPTPAAEPPARPELGVAIRAIRASVPDLGRSLAFFHDVLRLESVEEPIHLPEHEALWGLDGSQRDIRLLAAGNVFLELVQYRDPAGDPWPDGYQLSDGGVMNIALQTTSAPLFDEMRERVAGSGYESADLFPSEDVAVSYMTDDQGFSVELICMQPSAYADFGFLPEAAVSGRD
jgi:catechol 2,3-dioxygenase-like lactoylglutathione lyase family enzyme